MTTTLLGIFDDATAARRAMETLRNSDLDLDDVSIVSRATTSGEAVTDAEDVSAAEGATVGAVWGGLVGLAALLIPGVGPFVAGGALFAAITGAAAGAAVGGITAALIDTAGISEDEARHYENMVHEGKTLIVVKTDDEDAAEARSILADAGASIHENTTDAAISTTQAAAWDETGKRVNQDVEYSTPNTLSGAQGRLDDIARGYDMPRTPSGLYDTPEVPGDDPYSSRNRQIAGETTEDQTR